MLFDSPNLTVTSDENDFFYTMNITTIALIFVSLLLTSCHTEYKQPSPDKTIHYVPQSSKQMNTTSPVFLGQNVSQPTPKIQHKVSQVQRQIDNNMVEYSGDMYEQILEYYDHQTVYYPL